MYDSEAEFQSAIDASPNDDSLRLRFADWLERREGPRAIAVRTRVEQIRNVKQKLARLAKIERSRNPFTLHRRKYALRSPLRSAVVRSIEQELQCTLPEDYVDFLVRVAESGPGPAHRLIGLRESIKHCQRKPFPLDKEVQLPVDGDDIGYDLPIDAIYSGCIMLASHGCGSETHLVILGKEKGNVWEFWGAGDRLWHNYGKSFLTWYEGWLDKELEQAEWNYEQERALSIGAGSKPWWKVWQ